MEEARDDYDGDETETQASGSYGTDRLFHRLAQMIGRFRRDQSGAMLAEYALMMAILCAGAVCVLFYLGDTISSAMVHAGDAISNEWELVRSGGPID